ncbi:MAG: family 43 glycosylhydrolase, partial [Flavobacteriales bacterium]|nr:family 43 glycosylhydrolase [Flavobacteriales bacterium]
MWESTDLVDWKYKTSTKIESFYWGVLWAPEMYYYRGAFYIYLSGPGGKMAVWKYELPVGENNPEPFGDNAKWVAITHDFLKAPDHAIDGSILIEPNGDKYAFFSGFNGIKYRKINSMDDGNGGPITQLTQCVVNNIPKDHLVGDPGWTESPTTFKYKGKYYLTYTGNHYLRDDYQMHLAVGTSFQNFTPISNNPWISHPVGEWTGTGNCYPILGPNLKDYYYAYHTKLSSDGSGATPADQILRKLMIDKVEFKPTTIETKAPTYDDQLIPSQATYENNFSSGLSGFTKEGSGVWTSLNGFALKVEAPTGCEHRIYSDETTADNFVVEASVRMDVIPNSGLPKVAFIQGELGQDPNLLVGLDASESKSRLVIYDDKNKWQNIDMPDNFDVKDWTDIRIEKNGTSLRIFVNNVDILEKTIEDFKGASVGYMAESCTANVSWLAFSNI